MAKIIYMTASDEQEAQRIGRTLVERRLAACVNILGRIDSIFWWDGKVQSEGEIAFIAKTSDEKAPEVLAAVQELHSYDVPCAVALPITDGLPPFLSWIDNEVRKER
ncbi:divalent-cation tolerance protein CutA [Oleidesulfovibrio sp.]|uniref:divalent-cation tolerance protein CutA n=1 Tax=Oleidesulfovibrio sp. TaxID=2909707 RepID=UPI003A8C5836